MVTGYETLRAICESQGVRMPYGMALRSQVDVSDFIGRHGLPVVLKRSGSFGGQGVIVAHTDAEAEHALVKLSSGLTLLRSLWRSMAERDLLPMADYLYWRRYKPPMEVSIQRFIAGEAANCTIAAWKGKVLASSNVLAVKTSGATGPATVVRNIENSEMAMAAQAIAQRLAVSGFWGFDFILEKGSQKAFLLEVNPRATPACGLKARGVSELVGSLCRQLGFIGKERSGTPSDLVDAMGAVAVHFPGEWLRDRRSAWLAEPQHNVPWAEPEFLRACLSRPYEESGVIARLRPVMKRLLPLKFQAG